MTTSSHSSNKGNISAEGAAEVIREEVAARAGKVAHDKVLENTEVAVKSNVFKNFISEVSTGALVTLAAVTGIALGTVGTIAIQRRMAARAETPMEPVSADVGDVHFEASH